MKKQILNNQRGQTLIEYLIIVALVGVGSIALMRSVSQNINVKFAGVVRALGGNVEGNPTGARVSKSMYRKRDLKDFASETVADSSGKSRGAAGENQSSDSAE